MPIRRSPQTSEILAQAFSPSVAIDSVRNGCRSADSALGSNGARRSGSIFVKQNALQLSSANRSRITASAEAVLCLVRGKWKLPILAAMLESPVRLGELRRLIPRASKKVLVQQLHELENDGIIVRTDFSGKIKHVEYTIAATLGDEVATLLGFLSDWGLRNAPVMAVSGRTRILGRPVVEWSIQGKNVATMCVEAAPKKTPKDFRVIVGVHE